MTKIKSVLFAIGLVALVCDDAGRGPNQQPVVVQTVVAATDQQAEVAPRL